MGFKTSGRRIGLRATLIAMALAAVFDAAAQTPATAAHAKAKDTHGASAAGAGFTIERLPAWVQPLAYDPGAPIAAAPYQILVSDRQFRVQGAVTTDFMHYVRQVNAASGLAPGGQVQLEFDPSYQKLVLHRLDILRGTQRINKLDAKNVKLLHREQQLERQVVDGRMTASIVLDDLRVGDKVEWEASIVGANPVFGGRFVAGDWTRFTEGPFGQWQVRLVAPADRDIHVKIGDATVQSTSSVHADLRETLLKGGNQAQLATDERLPPAEYLKSQVEFSEFADWKQVADWGAQLFARSMQPTPALDAQVAALRAKAGPDATPEALLRTTLDFVQKDIRYFGTESGIDSHQPADVDTVLRQRFGDCKDKVSLLAALLTRMGFDARPALVSAAYNSATAQRLPGPQAFDHAIVRVVADGKPVWLDATRSEQTGSIAARESRGLGFALIAQAGTTELVALPNARDQVHAEIVDTFAFPSLAQEGTMTSVAVAHGDFAEGLRAALASRPRDEIEKNLISDTLRAYPTLTPTGPVEFDTVTEDNTVKVTSHYRTGDYWKLPEQRALLGRFVLYGLYAPLRMPDQSTRTQPFALASPGRYLQTVRYDFGDAMPPPQNATHFDEVNNNFELHVKFEAIPSGQQISGELDQLTDQIAPQDWVAYREALNKIDSHLTGGMTVPPFTPAQMEALRTEGPALMAKMRKGEVRVATAVQASAQVKLLAMNKELASGRLPPKLRAQALLARGVELDYLGRTHDAEADFRESIQLDPTAVDAHEALAINAVYRRDDAEAMKEADETLRLSPSDAQPHFVRGYLHFFGGDPGAAAQDFRDALQSRSEVERGYGALWLYVATRRSGGDGIQAVKPFEPTSSHPEWPNAVLQLMEGKVDLDAALVSSHENGQRSPSRECELYFYAGEKAIADGDVGKARTYLAKSVATGVTEFNEYVLSQRELSRMGSR